MFEKLLLYLWPLYLCQTTKNDKKQSSPWEHCTWKDFWKDEPVPILPKLISISKGPGSTSLSKVITIRGHKLPLIECSPHCHARWHAASLHDSPRAGLFSSALPLFAYLMSSNTIFPTDRGRKQALFGAATFTQGIWWKRRSSCGRRQGRVFLDSKFITDTVRVDFVPASFLAHSFLLWSRKIPSWADLSAFTLKYRGTNSVQVNHQVNMRRQG